MRGDGKVLVVVAGVAFGLAAVLVEALGEQSNEE